MSDSGPELWGYRSHSPTSAVSHALKDESRAFFNGQAWNFDKFVIECRIDLDHRFVSAYGLLEILFPLVILTEYLAPGRRDKDSAVIAEGLRGASYVVGDWDPNHD